VTDGTGSGTFMLKDIAPGSASAFSYSVSLQFAVLGSELLFVPNATKQSGLWETDGTSGGTVMLAATLPSFYPPYFSPEVATANGVALFDGYDDVHGAQLWSTDGTPANTALIKDIDTGTQGSYQDRDDTRLARFVSMNGSVYFTSSDPALGGFLWKTNGAASGTSLVAQVVGRFNQLYTGPQDLTVAGGALYFVTNMMSDPTLWKSDGTAAGTTIVEDSASGGFQEPAQLVAFQGSLYFASTNGIWKSDGTAGGTVQIFSGQVDDLQIAHGLLFIATANSQLWESNGTAGGTVLLQSLPGSFQNALAANGELYYTLETNDRTWELWKTNGTSAGTQMIVNLTSAGASDPADFVNVNGTIYFVADGTGGWQLWKSDGTTAGTQIVTDFTPASGILAPNSLVNNNGTLYFIGAANSTDAGLWKSDGTAAGTVLVADIGLPDDYYARDLTAMSGYLFFAGDDGLHGPSLWEIDGSPAGTYLVPGIRKEGASNPDALTAIGNRLFLLADDGIHGMEPWLIHATPPVGSAALPSNTSQPARVSSAACFIGVHDQPFPAIGVFSVFPPKLTALRALAKCS
jgi:ELWxxDGT repeat protein